MPRSIYADGSVQSNGQAGFAVFTDMDALLGGWVGRRLPDSSSSTYCELCGILDAARFLCRRGLSAVIICDSQSALGALSSGTPQFPALVNSVLSLLTLGHARGITIKFMWVPSHVNLAHHDRVDALAKAAYTLNHYEDCKTQEYHICFFLPSKQKTTPISKNYFHTRRARLLQVYCLHQMRKTRNWMQTTIYLNLINKIAGDDLWPCHSSTHTISLML
ncbi:uncharacterized protein LOC123517580 [Portunus trituberculatus]|uniref:uncharacterized protein LOC123517580 n=1 Tax=Portunus trituberculatus TaxID=210409 RepID=UPI001E1D0729|nr:uncharacterized protein LOC123517580 [Portunus trituberculatus]